MKSFLLFHTIAELFSIVIALGILTIAWNSRRYLSHSFFLFLGVAYAAVGALDLIHTVAYKGIGVLPYATANEPTQLWIAARYLNAAALLLAPLFLTRRMSFPWLVLPLLAITAALLTAIFTGHFPDAYLDNDGGLTTFKIASEYLICLIIAAAMLFLYSRRRFFDKSVLRLLLASMALTILTELAFTLYVDVHGIVNVIGHLLKITAFALLYRAIIVTGLQRPYQALFRDLHLSEERYRNLVSDSPDAIVVHDSGQILYANAAALALYGAEDFEALAAHDYFQRIAPANRSAARERNSRAAAGQHVPSIENRITRLEGSEVPVETIISPVRYGNHPAVQVIMRDLSTRLIAEQKLREFNAQLEARVQERTAQLQLRTEQLQALAMELSTTEDRERRRLADILHDDLQQMLVAIQFQLDVLARKNASDNDAADMFRQTSALLKEAIQKSRTLSHELSPPTLRQAGLLSAIEWQASQMHDRYGLEVDLDLHPDAEPATEPLKPFLFKAVRELLFNIVKHAGVRKAAVSLQRTNANIVVTVSDPGQGFHHDDLASENGKGFGLFSIRERLELLGGQLHIQSKPGKGSTFVLYVRDKPWVIR